MDMKLTIPYEIAYAVEELSRQSGETPESILLKMLSAHFPPKSANLQEEFDALEQASDEDFQKDV